MTTAPLHLAIAHGSLVTIWDCRNENTVHSIEPHGEFGNVSDIAWHHSGQVLASCSTSTDKQTDSVWLTSIQSNTATRLESFRHDVGLQHPQGSPMDGTVRSLSFVKKSRYLCLGDDNGAVCLWDMKKKARVRHYWCDEPCLQLSMDSSEQASLYSLTSNALHVFPLRKGESNRTIPCRSSQFMSFASTLSDPTHVVLGCEDGRIDLWDVVASELVRSWSPHTKPVTATAISPINRVLLASASLDGSLAFSDTDSGITIQTIAVGAPIHTLSLHHNGMSCAVGTEDGAVHVYDLRQPDVPCATWRDANQLSVHAVAFAPSVLTDRDDDAISAPSSPVHATGTVGSATVQRSTPESLDERRIRDVFRDELGAMRDELDQSLRNMHVDMLRSFQSQSHKFHSAVEAQTDTITKLVAENDALRQEIQRLRLSLR